MELSDCLDDRYDICGTVHFFIKITLSHASVYRKNRLLLYDRSKELDKTKSNQKETEKNIMKKSILTKIAVLGVIGVMTLAGAGSALAADGGATKETTMSQMLEKDAMAIINQAKEQGEDLGVNGNNDIVVKQGNDTYEYHFYATEKRKVEPNKFSKREYAEQYIRDAYIYDAEIEEFYDGDVSFCTDYCVKGYQNYGNLNVCHIHNTDIESINMNVECGRDEIHPDELAIITYSVNEGADSGQLTFESSDENVATIETDDTCVYVTGHSDGVTMINAYGANNKVVKSVRITVKTQQ